MDIDKTKHNELREEIAQIKEGMKGMGDKVDKIHTAIVGEEKFGYIGLVKMVEKHEKWITGQKFRLAYVSGGVGVLWTLLLKFWDKIF